MEVITRFEPISRTTPRHLQIFVLLRFLEFSACSRFFLQYALFFKYTAEGRGFKNYVAVVYM
ncbi:MAG: hypothetical protein QMD23_03160, partial [Candidatus Bathyarchaeia archaeon]|nr:hypothetical protein [Candidatus Bathyarchaeia archaeon]